MSTTALAPAFAVTPNFSVPRLPEVYQRVTGQLGQVFTQDNATKLMGTAKNVVNYVKDGFWETCKLAAKQTKEGPWQWLKTIIFSKDISSLGLWGQMTRRFAPMLAVIPLVVSAINNVIVSMDFFKGKADNSAASASLFKGLIDVASTASFAIPGARPIFGLTFMGLNKAFTVLENASLGQSALNDKFVWGDKSLFNLYAPGHVGEPMLLDLYKGIFGTIDKEVLGINRIKMVDEAPEPINLNEDKQVNYGLTVKPDHWSMISKSLMSHSNDNPQNSTVGLIV